MKKAVMIALFASFVGALCDGAFEQNWRLMQQEYAQMNAVFAPRLPQLQTQFMHPYWQRQRQLMAQIIQGNIDISFLTRAPISGPMVRTERCKTQDYELVCLGNCLSAETQEAIARFSDTDFGGVKRTIGEFNCSINTLGQLYFFAKMLDRNPPDSIDSIIELGGGYGCLARVAKMIIPSATYVIFDLPEYLAVQGLYLRTTLPQVSVKMHIQVPQKLEPGVIHLIPVYLLPECDFTADLFISTAALSETPEAVQKMVVDKRFFNARSTYITGQLNQWGSRFNFVHHGTVMQGMRNCYELCFAQPLHHFDSNLHCYEIYGTLLKK